ncbi:Rab geranylgeranyltransferase [Cryptotrichosporon argae]
MHGVKRTRLTPEAAEARRLKELSKTQAYIALEDAVLALKRDKVYTQAALGKTTELLDLNPEFYTVWNYRRLILLDLFAASEPAAALALVQAELRQTMAYLRVHPKVYWIWTHRKWALEHVPAGPGGTQGWRDDAWRTELAVVERILEADARNFHAWGYRRYVLDSLPASFAPVHTPATDLAYTKRKIETSISNFSAWHYRTKTLEAAWAGLDADELRRRRDEEFELVLPALYTAPDDQSGWLYHRWLIGSNPPLDVLDRELAAIEELHELEPDSKWCMNALAHYRLVLAGLDASRAADARRTAKQLLARLQDVDPDRRARYAEMAARC